jgi:rod shape determining protein RodA
MSNYVQVRAAARARQREAAGSFAYLRRLDWPLVAAVVLLVAYGLWSLAGITRHDVPGNPSYYLVRQGIFVAIGVALLAAALLVDPALYRRAKRPIYVVLVLLIAVVFPVAEVTRGSQRWIEFGFFRFQPSEFGKLLLAVFLAAFLADASKRLGSARTVASACALAVLPILLVFLQPDLGTALVYVAVFAGALFVAGTSWRHLGALAVLAAVAVLAVLWWLPAAGVDPLEEHQRERLTAITNPDYDPRGTTYNVRQSMLAVGAGGFRGKGVEGATQTRLDYLPEHSTDFVFASLAEQRGFVGAGFLLVLYAVVVWRGLRIVAGARDLFGAIAGGAIVFGLLFQIFVNVGMTIGIAPVTGIPLPFVSVGGSSMISSLVAVGILLAIGARSRVRPR